MNTHKDCNYYLPVDVFKGICKRDKQNIIADDTACESFKQVEKCEHCMNYSAEDEFLGKCKNTTMAYAQMTASTCTEFEWKKTGK